MNGVQRLGDTVRFGTPPALTAWAATAGKKESEGPLAGKFDESSADDYFGCDSWEKAETELQRRAVKHLIHKKGIEKEEYISPACQRKNPAKVQCCEVLRKGIWKVALEPED